MSVPDIDPFSLDSNVNFHKFLSAFERRCSSKFAGPKRDWTGELGKLLVGDMKNYYNSFGGSSKSYSSMKKLLLEEYKRGRKQRKVFREKLFLNASMQSGEKVTVYSQR